MTSPVRESAATTDFNSDTTAHVCNMPAGVVAGNLLIALFGNDGASATVSENGGHWTKFKDLQDAGPEGRLTAWYRVADGTADDIPDFVTSVAESGGAILYRISGAENPATQPPEASAGVGANSAAPDPDSLSPSGGSKDYLFLAAACIDSDPILSGPSNMTNFLNAGRTVAPQQVGLVGVGAAELAVTAASFNPNAFAADSADNWAAFTIAVHPAAASDDDAAARRRQEDY